MVVWIFLNGILPFDTKETFSTTLMNAQKPRLHLSVIVIIHHVFCFNVSSVAGVAGPRLAAAVRYAYQSWINILFISVLVFAPLLSSPPSLSPPPQPPSYFPPGSVISFFRRHLHLSPNFFLYLFLTSIIHESNAGGIGTLGAIGMSPSVLRKVIRKTKSLLHPGRPFGVDLLLPKVGGSARATNTDYTKGKLGALIDVIIEEGAKLFVCAVGVPPKEIVDKLHSNGIVVMNMIGSPRHVKGCLRAGVDIICAQGTEGGGHTGGISTLVLIPQVVDLCRPHGVIVVGAGGIYDGRGVAACLALGAEGAWLGSRFIMTKGTHCLSELEEQEQGYVLK